jgi:hypothetical protein
MSGYTILERSSFSGRWHPTASGDNLDIMILRTEQVWNEEHRPAMLMDAATGAIVYGDFFVEPVAAQDARHLAA